MRTSRTAILLLVCAAATLALGGCFLCRNLSPLAQFTVEHGAGTSVDFDGTGSSDINGTIVSYEWDFTNDGTFDATGPTVSHVYQGADTFVALLKVTDNDSLTDTETVQITLTYPLGDFDLDNDVDQADFGVLQLCLSGPLVPVQDGCEPADLNSDDVVDQNDVSVFLDCMNGADQASGC